MDTEEFNKKAKDEFKKVTSATKSAFEKFGDKVQGFTDKTVTKVKKNQLETERSCKYEELGMKVSAMLLEGAEIKSENQNDIEILNSLQKEIAEISKKIAEKEELLKR